MKKEDILEEVFEKHIKRISEKRGIPIEKLITEYEKILNLDKVRRQSGDEKEKALWAGKILHNKFMSKEPVTSYSMVIPFGTTEPRVKKGAEDKEENMFAVVYAAVKEAKDSAWEVKEIAHRGKYAKMVQTVQMLRAYRDVRLYNKGYFIEPGDDTKYENPQKVKMSPDDFIIKICKFQKLDKLSDMITHISRRDDSGKYPDRNDMYLVEGMIQRGFKKGYTIKDESLEYEEKGVNIAGEELIMPQSITVWIPSRFYKWDDDSELAFLGTIDISQKDKKPVMNSVLVYPAGFVCELPEGGKEKDKK